MPEWIGLPAVPPTAQCSQCVAGSENENIIHRDHVSRGNSSGIGCPFTRCCLKDSNAMIEASGSLGEVQSRCGTWTLQRISNGTIPKIGAARIMGFLKAALHFSRGGPLRSYPFFGVVPPVSGRSINLGHMLDFSRK